MTEETTIPTSQTPARTRQDIGVLIQDELSIAGVTESSFAALKEEAQALSLMDVSSDADAQAIQKVITKGVRLCSTISATIEPGKKWAHQLHKAYTSNENEFLGTVKAIIEPLKQKKEAWVAKKEQAEREELERQQAVIKARFAALEVFGFTRRTGVGREDYFSNGTTELEIIAVSSANDEAWAIMLTSAQEAYNDEQDRIKAAEAARLADEERVKKEAAELEARRKELEAREAAMNARINEARRAQLIAAGGIWQIDMPMEADLSKMDEAEFGLLLVRVAENEMARKEQKAKEQEKERAMQEAKEAREKEEDQRAEERTSITVLTMSTQLIKVARCKHCGHPFAGHIVPIKRPSEDLTMSQRLSDYEKLLNIHDRFDIYAWEGHAVSVEQNSLSVALTCECR